MYVGKHASCMYLCVYVYIYVLTSLFMEVDMHEYVGMYICIHVYLGRYA